MDFLPSYAVERAMIFKAVILCLTFLIRPLCAENEQYNLVSRQTIEYEFTSQLPNGKAQGTWTFWVLKANGALGWQLLGYSDLRGLRRLCLFELSPSGEFRHLDEDTSHLRAADYVFPRLPKRVESSWKGAPSGEGDFFVYKMQSVSGNGRLTLSSEKQSSLKSNGPGTSVVYVLQSGTRIPEHVEYRDDTIGEYYTLTLKRTGEFSARFEELTNLYFAALRDANKGLGSAIRNLQVEDIRPAIDQVIKNLRQARKSLVERPFSTAFDDHLASISPRQIIHEHEWWRWKMNRVASRDWETLAPFELVHKANWRENTYDLKKVVNAHTVTVLDFCRNKCGPCLKAMNETETVKKVLNDPRVAFVGMNSDTNEKDISEARRDLEALKVSYPVLRAGEACHDENAFYVESSPIFLIIDKLGIVREILVGYESDHQNRLKAAIQRVLK
jgi:thiol-disulfide isomerase/thioredoxin